MYSPMLIVHILGGMAALVSGYLALFTSKGSPLHQRTGDVFVVSMMFMGGFGAIVSLQIGQVLNAAGGMAAFYLVVSGWLTMQRRAVAVRRTEIGAMVFAIASSLGLFALGRYRLDPAHVPMRMEGPTGCFFIAALFLLFAIGDARMLALGGVTGPKRLVRHIWRMCIGLFAASGSFFLGRSNTEPLHSQGLRAKLFTNAIQATHITLIPVLLIIVMMIYWIVRVKITKTYARGILAHFRRNGTTVGRPAKTLPAETVRAYE